MNADQSISLLLDELVSGQAGGKYLQENLDLILIWLANPKSDSAAQFRSEYIKRNISVEILRGYVFFILQQKLFSNNSLQPHEVLGLSRTSTEEQAKARYRKLMRVFHPDKAVGNVENFNSIAEKINLAYRQFLKEKDKSAQVKIDSPQSKSTVYRPADVKNDKIESPLIRKVRQKFGSVKQFQLLFFGAVASFCIFVIVLLYLQSGDSQQLQSYSSRAKAQDLDYDASEIVLNESASTVMNQIAEIETDTNIKDDSNNNQQVIEEPALIAQTKLLADSATKSLSDAESSEPVDSLLNNVQLSERLLSELESTLKDKDALDIDDYQVDRNLPATSTMISTDQTSVAVVNAQHANDKTVGSETVNDQFVNHESKLPETDSADAVKENQPVQAGIKPSLQINEKLASEQTEIQSTISTFVPTPMTEQQAEATDTDNKGVVEDVPVSEQVSDLLTAAENNTPLNQSENLTDAVPVKEVEITSLKPVAVGNFPAANLFEKRFVRKFLVDYLESIEDGDVLQIRNYLSSNLIIDGVENTRADYLKNTFTLINQTSKRQYHVHFVGDVLRLDSGVFRVVVLLNHTYTFKNNIVSKNSTQKIFDIKRYTNGSEIINISSV